jgi:predicted RNA-binding Zn-ribbon protein involved in translation (DUF1610 family)
VAFFFIEVPMSNRSSKKHSKNYDSESNSFQKILKKEHTFSNKTSSEKRPETKFKCVNCGAVVSTDRELAGVNNRNHCPVCLWSKHVDENKAGDRKAICKSKMKPVGLTIKKTRNKYSEEKSGELMLIHRCTGCGKVSINRIASDDSSGALIALYQGQDNLTDEFLLELAAQNIEPLLADDITIVFSQLFGWQSILSEFETNGVKNEALIKIEEFEDK